MTTASARAGLVLVCVFAVGALTGVAIDRHHLPPATRAALESVEDHERMMGELRQELDLDAEQMAQIQRLLNERQHVVQQMWEQLRPEVQNAMRDVHTEIAKILRPEQRERFHGWLMSQQARAGSETLPH